ncbi:2'-5' RNA ligase family protein [Nocardia gamkensis]|uniref:2'-5' RNA ligase family protein n=1 Tax=Nocardia gamkensis TaxID=352869 RepID=A0A7X6L6R0_9NOCA|nr:2'-5' RNA ligase family protein [Nocardia gamkensis]NKY28699.1 2'-5' RNA ligase family protein [Nocardia gamkensis]
MSDMDNAHGREPRGQLGLLGYYWFLTFEQSPALRVLTEQCQRPLDATRFRRVHSGGLHLTLDRIAHDGGTAPEQLQLVESAARRACRDEAPFTLTISELTNLGGAIGFAVSPAERVRLLRDTLRTATRSVLPDAPVKDSLSVPHITIAYPLFEGLSAESDAVAMESKATIEGVAMKVTEAVMVALERHEHSYSWTIAAEVPLTGR